MIITLFLFCSSLLCMAHCDHSKEEFIIHEIFSAGDFVDFDSENFKENTVDKLSPEIREECLDFLRKFIDESDEVQKILKEIKTTGKMDTELRDQLLTVFWRKLWKNKQDYESKMEKIGKKMLDEKREVLEDRLQKTQDFVMRFAKGRKDSSKQKRSHCIQKRLSGEEKTIVLGVGAIMAAILITQVVPVMINAWLGGICIRLIDEYHLKYWVLFHVPQMSWDWERI